MIMHASKLIPLLSAGLLLCAGVPAQAQEAPATSAKGFVEVGLGYGYQLSTADFIEVDNGTKLESPHSKGPALDVGGGYALIPHLFIFGDLQFASAHSLTGVDQDGDETRLSMSYTSFAVGLRSTVAVGGHEIYVQMALGLLLPFDTEVDETFASGGRTSRNTTTGYNSGFGARGELGYHHNLNDRMYLAGGLRLQAFASDNVGKDRVRTEQPSGDVEIDRFTTNPNAGNNQRDAQTLSVQDLRLRIGFGYRF